MSQNPGGRHLVGETTVQLGNEWEFGTTPWKLACVVGFGLASVGLFAATHFSFDRCLGRAQPGATPRKESAAGGE